MSNLSINIEDVFEFATQDQVFGLETVVEQNLKALHAGTGKGSNYLGWLSLPSSTSDEELERILPRS
jgi:glucose-6-phosphate isomerase